jgi:hypothetical protein
MSLANNGLYNQDEFFLHLKVPELRGYCEPTGSVHLHLLRHGTLYTRHLRLYGIHNLPEAAKHDVSCREETSRRTSRCLEDTGL